MVSDISSLESKIKDLSSEVAFIKNNPTQAVLDKIDDRDKLLGLEIQLQIRDTLNAAHEKLEEKIDSKIKEAFSSQSSKISWGLEIARFLIVAIMFILSIRLV